jgi:hypothetical protein
MIDTKLKYQAVIFVINEDITPNSKTIQRLMSDVFADYELIPNTFFELNNFNPQPTPRLRFSSINNEWNISFGATRLDIEKLPTDQKGENLGELKSFCENAIKITDRLFSVFPKKANRVSLVTDAFLTEMPSENLYEIYCRLFTPPETLIKNKPTEWNFRSVVQLQKEISNLTEDVNFIGAINRMSGSFLNIENFNAAPKFDRIQVTTDINTSQFNKEFRFDINFIKDYYSSVVSWTESFREEILKHIL